MGLLFQILTAYTVGAVWTEWQEASAEIFIHDRIQVRIIRLFRIHAAPKKEECCTHTYRQQL
jgi:hypothetical protein